jgi:ubiquinone/menaquinone biosynthesis C-methylase UbiE
VSDFCAFPAKTLQAFDTLADRYDDVFTRSLIGRAQRDAVWNVLDTVFEPGARILELNCGTGEDALFLARNDIAVVACDGSAQMIATASQRLREEAPEAPIHFLVLPTEHLPRLRPHVRFDGALSNFSGLNCVADLDHAARELGRLVVSRAPVMLCMSTRFCLSETLWFLFHGKFRKAFRRMPGRATAKLGPYSVEVYYPTLARLKRVFSPWFRLRAVRGIGVTVPPSYLETIMRRWPRLLSCLHAIDRRIAHLPGFRVLGDHMLLHFERVEEPAC